MTVTAWDMGIERKSANLSVTVNVSDVNDNLPVFTSPVEFNQTVAATIQSSDVIMKINVSLLEAGGFQTPRLQQSYSRLLMLMTESFQELLIR